MISREKIKNIAKLSMLKFCEEEIELFTETFNERIEYIDGIQRIDTEGVKPTYQVNNNYQYLREDVIGESFSREEALKNAPNEQFGYFKLPKVLD
ncbi:MAG TPA: Asp-tRNA(Asn)/Glu-tRNA(Gln) amidotransferase subunit GatC [Tissierellales bacterium]|nr:Asp-tRNA(Asn)/Glu-tRNA(Gln) amidotransferase subunit GatC [Tissierellales bacterium]